MAASALICKVWNRSVVSCALQMYLTRDFYATCCGQILTRIRWDGGKTTEGSALLSVLRWLPNSFINMTWILSAELTRYALDWFITLNSNRWTKELWVIGFSSVLTPAFDRLWRTVMNSLRNVNWSHSSLHPIIAVNLIMLGLWCRSTRLWCAPFRFWR